MRLCILFQEKKTKKNGYMKAVIKHKKIMKHSHFLAYKIDKNLVENYFLFLS